MAAYATVLSDNIRHSSSSHTPGVMARIEHGGTETVTERTGKMSAAATRSESGGEMATRRRRRNRTGTRAGAERRRRRRRRLQPENQVNLRMLRSGIFHHRFGSHSHPPRCRLGKGDGQASPSATAAEPASEHNADDES